MLEELAAESGPEILPRLSRFRAILAEFASDHKRRDRTLTRALDKTEDAMRELRRRHAPLLAMWPDVFCAETWRRGELVEGAGLRLCRQSRLGQARHACRPGKGSRRRNRRRAAFSARGRKDIRFGLGRGEQNGSSRRDRPAGDSRRKRRALRLGAARRRRRLGKPQRPRLRPAVTLDGEPALDENSRRLLARFAEAEKDGAA